MPKGAPCKPVSRPWNANANIMVEANPIAENRVAIPSNKNNEPIIWVYAAAVVQSAWLNGKNAKY